MSDSYKPVSCGDYDRIELAIARGAPVSMEWHDESGGLCRGTGIPRNTHTRSGAEFLVIAIDGVEREIRLDRIIAWSPATA